MTKHFLSVLVFFVVTFTVQALSHFVLNVEHFTNISFARDDVIMPMGVSVIVIQGVILTTALGAYAPKVPRIIDGVIVAAAFGVFLASYIVLTEPAKYTVPDIGEWITVEATASFIQFLLSGLGIGFIHSKFSAYKRR